MNSVPKKKLVSKLTEIHKFLIQNSISNSNIGLLSGQMGVAIFQYRYAQFTKSSQLNTIGLELLHTVSEKINEGYNLPTFCSGIYGVAWGFDVLLENNDINLNEEAFFHELDQELPDALQFYFENKCFDFLHGYLGIGLYLIKRYENTTSNKLRDNYRKKLNQIILQLKNDSLVYDGISCWINNIDNKNGDSNINLGLAHGIASIIGFLSRIVIYPDFSATVKPLLKNAIEFVLRYESRNYTELSVFPDEILFKDGCDRWNSRLAWCHGDLGIGLSLWTASTAINDQSLNSKAIEILKHASLRRELKKNLVNDASLCHGSMGIMLIFDFLFKKTKILEFQKAANYWLKIGIQMDEEKNGITRKDNKDSWPWQNATGVLDGISGIGLALISYLSPKPLKWSQSLMIN